MNAPILIVDDDEVLGRVLGRVLARDGHAVILATDPDQALSLARTHHPLAALVDLCLPGTDGVAVARKLHGEFPGLPLILMTAFPLRLGDHPELGDHFSRVLVKPLELAVLREAIAAARPGSPGAVSLMKLS
jgi:CheY-like chemotaxis protein